MNRPPDDDFLAQAAAKKRAEEAITSDIDAWMRRFKFLIWLIGGLVLGTFAVGGWAIKIRIDLTAAEKETISVKGIANANATAITALNRLVDTMQNQINSNTSELKKREELIPKINEMWFMKEHGIPNRDDFYRKHGYVPQSSVPESGPVPDSSPQRK